MLIKTDDKTAADYQLEGGATPASGSGPSWRTIVSLRPDNTGWNHTWRLAPKSEPRALVHMEYPVIQMISTSRLVLSGGTCEGICRYWFRDSLKWEELPCFMQEQERDFDFPGKWRF
ncbi:hypothetical protein PG996_002549 [Apiospora saccharicola]|uniref:Uncharacterized protein n=1 Tax=Apiospora saccharicola TaxID=335842 RepID=A0ABR1WJY8_9PEZI